MEVNSKKLAEALYNIKEIHGIPWMDVTEKSGVHNIGRIVQGQITPTATSWGKLHDAYPDHIPPVEFSHDGEIYKNVSVSASGRSVAANNSGNITQNHAENIKTLSPAKQYAIQLITEADEPAVKEVIKILHDKFI